MSVWDFGIAGSGVHDLTAVVQRLFQCLLVPVKPNSAVLYALD